MKKIIGFIKVFIFLLAIVLIINILKNDFNSDNFKTLIGKASTLYLFLASFFVFLGIILKGHRLQIISKQFDITPSFFESIKIQVISITFAMITPGRAGEFTKIFLLTKEDKKKLPLGTVICIFERLIDVIILSLSGVFLCLFNFSDFRLTILLVLFALGILSSLFILFRLDFILKKLDKYIPEKIKDYINDFEKHKNKLSTKTPLIILYSIFIWYIDALFQWSLLKSVGETYSTLTVFGINGINAIMSILTILPMGLGTVDLSALYLYKTILNTPKEIIVFFLASSRFFGMGVLLLMILPIIIMQKDFIKSLYKKTT